MNDNELPGTELLEGVAIIGMAGRFPKAANVDEFWQNLIDSRDCIAFYTEEELIEAGIDPNTVKNPFYIKAKGEVGNVDMFDAAFFGINPREAEVTDPQHRMLLECAWEAMEHAGYDSFKYDGSIGIYAGKSMDYYLLLNVYPYIKKEISAGSLQAAIGNDKDSLTTTISYRLNLTGPGITIQTSSSTSLVAVCVAAQSLLTYQCDIALAGGITAGPPMKSGYLYQEGGIWSDDGHCRAFDARSKGFVPGSGMGMVVLKRLEEAVNDGDRVWAVIKGFSVNNDGSKKVSYSAPSVDAQSEVVSQALAISGFHPETIGYIETHGTGTHMGDPIEVTALTQAFRAYTDKKHFCAIGSAKSNIGHLDNAAGVAGLIKTTLAVYHGKIPASLHFEIPNPRIDFENCPFFVNTKLRDWPKGDTPRRAGVTSLGMGGTNAHVVIEEAPRLEKTGPSREWQLLMLSGKTATALKTRTKELAQYIGGQKEEETNLADVAFTLQIGRRDFDYRRFMLSRNLKEGGETLGQLSPGRVFDGFYDTTASAERPVVFMFSGQGAQYVNMARELYEKESTFHATMDECARILKPILGLDVIKLIYPAKEEDIEKNSELLMQTKITQPVLFMIEYSLARLWVEWGVKPVAMIGHSIGEFAALCLSGAVSMEDGLRIVSARGKFMQEVEEGSMLSVGATEKEVEEFLSDDISLAAVNSPRSCVISGNKEAIDGIEKVLTEKNIFCRKLKTSHAFHSAMMDGILSKFKEVISGVSFSSPQIPFISGVTGKWIREEELRSPDYWSNQLRRAVRFADGMKELMKDSARLFLEVGPGNGLCVLAGQNKGTESPGSETIFASVRHIKQTESDLMFILRTLGHLWLRGASVDWRGFYANEKRRRMPLPTYPFERKRYWLEGAKDSAPDKEMQTSEAMRAEKLQPVQVEADEKAARNFQPRPQLPIEYKAPANNIEKGIVEIWEDILGIHPIGIEDNFFDLGGHSLLATLFLSRVQEKFQVRLELRVIFESPTIAAISQILIADKDFAVEVKTIEDILAEVEGEKAKGQAESEKLFRNFQPRPQLPVAYKEPSNNIEEGIVDIWEDILGIHPIGVDDNFFDLGGHSLLATLFLSRLQEKFQVRLELRVIFESPTIGAIARIMVEEKGLTAESRKIEEIIDEIEIDPYGDIPHAPKKEEYVLSSSQKRFYLLQCMEPESVAYNMTGILDIQGRFDRVKFENVFKKLIQMHETLRTYFVMKQGEPWQRILDHVDFGVEYVTLPTPPTQESINAKIKEFIRPFDLTKAPLLRVGLLQMGEDKQLLMFDMHHIISDGTSLNLLARSFIKLYSDQALPAMKIQYKDFCEWQSKLLWLGKLKKEEEYWLNIFSGKLPILNLPTDYPRPEIPDYKGESILFTLDENITRQVNRLMSETGTTLFMFLLAVFNVLLGKYSSKKDIVVGLPIAGRNHHDLENIIGLLMETLALRNHPNGEKPFDEFLAEVKRNTVDAFENQAYPFRELVKKVTDETNLAHSPLFDVMLLVHSAQIGFKKTQIGDLSFTLHEGFSQGIAKTDLALEAEEINGVIHFILKYSTSLFKSETMQKFTGFFKQIIIAALENKSIRLEDIVLSHELKIAEGNLIHPEEIQFEF